MGEIYEQIRTLAKTEGILRPKDLKALGIPRVHLHNKNGSFWFGELLDSCFDLMKERFAGVDDSRKHDEGSILVG